ncbi:hypothetical protein QJS66_10865 [Kocuria rhizophila]|nr:hypothetical protein QJS66_10865 [Kocuria rhizophila]
MVRWMSARRPTRGSARQGRAAALGYDADMAVFAADESYVVDAQRLNHRPHHPVPGQGALREGARDLRGRARGQLRRPRASLLSRGQA